VYARSTALDLPRQLSAHNLELVEGCRRAGPYAGPRAVDPTSSGCRGPGLGVGRRALARGGGSAAGNGGAPGGALVVTGKSRHHQGKSSPVAGKGVAPRGQESARSRARVGTTGPRLSTVAGKGHVRRGQGARPRQRQHPPRGPSRGRRRTHPPTRGHRQRGHAVPGLYRPQGSGLRVEWDPVVGVGAGWLAGVLSVDPRSCGCSWLPRPAARAGG
jgi:hypothetical protein